MPRRPLAALLIALLALGLAAGIAPAQLVPALPRVPLGVPGLPGVDRLTDDVGATATAAARTLERARRQVLRALIADNPSRIAPDRNGDPARAGEVVVDDPSPAVLAAAEAKGYRLIEAGDVLGVRFARLAAPTGRPLRDAVAEIARLGADATADQLHRASGIVPVAAQAAQAGTGPFVGVIDGGAQGAARAAGFASGAPRANDHGTAVASLVTGGSGIRGALPGARIASADVYGSDPAGGNATAIAKALGWMVGERVPVVVISLVGPANPLLARVVAAAQARGTMIVAAVGNDGPASPPVYPASYPGVVAVTGVDARERPLIEAGRATHLDYAAPGADMLAAGIGGRRFAVRGTSFAAPLVAGTLARAYPVPAINRWRSALATVDRAAHKAPRTGRGIVCGDCRTPAK